MAQEYQSVRNKNNIDSGSPRKYKVIFHNDDFTTMDFVMDILKQIFFKSETEAFSIMMEVHKKGQAIVGHYSFDTAVSKRAKAIALAREEKFPLNITVEPAD